MNRFRRKLLLATAAMMALPGSAAARRSRSKQGRIQLADFGGVPGASATRIIDAFEAAFDKLKRMGGGELLVAPGTYKLGRFSAGTAISVENLKNVRISAYGALLMMRTTKAVTPVFMRFDNPSNITIEGMRFFDSGTDLEASWKGAICLLVEASARRSGFRTVDCAAENVVTFLQSQQPEDRYQFEGFDIHATVRNAYYGVNPNFNGRHSRCNLTCTNVRRAFIAQGARDWDVTVQTSRSSGPGSNAHVVLVPLPDAPVRDVRINLSASGDLSRYLGLVSICHQGGECEFSFARNVRIRVKLSNVKAPAGGIVTFTAEPPGSGALQPSTVSAWEDIEITGSVAGPYDGPAITNTSKSSAKTNAIYVAPNLAAYQDMKSLPDYFHIIREQR